MGYFRHLFLLKSLLSHSCIINCVLSLVRLIFTCMMLLDTTTSLDRRTGLFTFSRLNVLYWYLLSWRINKLLTERERDGGELVRSQIKRGRQTEESKQKKLLSSGFWTFTMRNLMLLTLAESRMTSAVMMTEPHTRTDMTIGPPAAGNRSKKQILV